MEDYKPYTAKRWTEPIKPVSLGPAKEFTEEEMKKYDSDMENIMKEYGVLRPGEHIKNGKVIKDDTTSQ